LVDNATYPLQRAGIFHTGLDVVALDDKGFPIGRPFLSVILDEFSGYPIGYYLGFEQPSYKTVKLAIHHAISLKCYIKERFPEVKNS
jgi:putative transposase